MVIFHYKNKYSIIICPTLYYVIPAKARIQRKARFSKNLFDQDFIQIKLLKSFKVLDSRLRGNDIEH
ncbi:hypothetical protein RFEPED_0311 [Rickettsia felis str. Pedreira]|uniref:Uncharacterized protein n=1 Tax=Rickettsia felis str. Pedreira TaxID=1359196 RepID=A0A0F3MQB4_RICFI|nr:hypothetical protein JS55_03060 [Rickettsia felis str. LSU]KHO03818.1 hypothetical protein JS61_02985 [Rickettsia felis]KJV57940.1 hypothetical protein RFEPED_0311 [Rickettsia felis str. Pedreira]